jgi:uncharacterized membrane protein YbhN (UPF0104 family)
VGRLLGHRLARVAALIGLIAALGITLMSVDLAAVQRSIPTDAWPLLLIALAAGAVAMVFRAMAWRPFVSRIAPDQAPSWASLFVPVAAASFLNGVLPARTGEAARIALTTRRLGLGAARVTGTIVSDAFGSLVAWALVAGTLLAALTPGGVTPVIVAVAWLAVAVGAVAARATRVEGRAPRPGAGRIARVAHTVVGVLGDGMRGLRDLRASIPAVAASVGAWVAQLLVVAVAIEALVPVGVTPAMVASTFIMFTAAQAAPVLPGGIGTTQAAVMTPLIALYGVGAAEALAVAVVLPLALWLPVALIGWLAGAHAALREPISRATQET